MRIPERQRGFSLVELMVVVVVIGILASIATKTYRDHVINSRRAAAVTCMVEGVQAMERFYTTNLTYVGATTATLPTCDADTTQFYAITLGGTAPKTFTITARPLASQASGDTKCATLTLDAASRKDRTGPGSIDDCF